MSENHIIVTDIVKLYQGNSVADVPAVNEISLEVPHGQFLSIMGASGSGKTTLLQLIAGLVKPTSGSVDIDDTRITDLNDKQLTLFRRQHIGFVFQSFNLIPTLTAEENILLPALAGHLKNTTQKQLDAALDELLERLELVPRRKHFPETLSGGEQQRVAIARALLVDFASGTNGSLLLADEPTGNLDSVNSRVICKLLRDLCNERKHTMLVVTHEQSVADWSDRTITLKDGKIIDDKFNSNKN